MGFDDLAFWRQLFSLGHVFTVFLLKKVTFTGIPMPLLDRILLDRLDSQHVRLQTIQPKIAKDQLH